MRDGALVMRQPENPDDNQMDCNNEIQQTGKYQDQDSRQQRDQRRKSNKHAAMFPSFFAGQNGRRSEIRKSPRAAHPGASVRLEV
jgi:hypothetical protein